MKCKIHGPEREGVAGRIKSRGEHGPGYPQLEYAIIAILTDRRCKALYAGLFSQDISQAYKGEPETEEGSWGGWTGKTRLPHVREKAK